MILHVYRIDTTPEAGADLSDAALRDAMSKVGMTCWITPGPDGIGVFSEETCVSEHWSTLVSIDPLNPADMQWFASHIAEAPRGRYAHVIVTRIYPAS
jgi:hypothetical protein